MDGSNQCKQIGPVLGDPDEGIAGEGGGGSVGTPCSRKLEISDKGDEDGAGDCENEKTISSN